MPLTPLHTYCMYASKSNVMERNVIEERRISLPDLGIVTRVLEAGAGPSVLMLHGNPDNADEWAPLIARLGARYRCIAPDFPGYGKSPEPPRAFTYDLADQMRFCRRDFSRSWASPNPSSSSSTTPAA